MMNDKNETEKGSIHYSDIDFIVEYSYQKQRTSSIHFSAYPNEEPYTKMDDNDRYLVAGWIDFSGIMKIEYNNMPFYMDQVVFKKHELLFSYIRKFNEDRLK